VLRDDESSVSSSRAIATGVGSDGTAPGSLGPGIQKKRHGYIHWRRCSQAEESVMRNAFNRILMLVVSFVSFGFGIIVLLLLAGWITPGEVGIHGTILYGIWNFFAQMRHSNPLFDILVGAICAGVGLVVFLMELFPARTPPRQQVM
jgi:hypothetical protein